MADITFADGVGRTNFELKKDLFNGLTTLNKVTLPNDLVKINEGVFANTSITEITIPESVNDVGINVFRNCANLKSVIFNSPATPHSKFTWRSGTSATAPATTTTSLSMFEGCSLLEHVELPYGVNYIGFHLFKGLSSLKSVVLPDSLLVISDEAFEGTGLTDITIPKSVTTIGISAFADCNKLANITFEQGGTANLVIGNNSFESTAINAVTIPNRAVSIGNNAFYNTDDLQFLSFETGSKLTSIGAYAFAKSGIQDLSIPKTVTSIDNAAFVECYSLNTISVENGNTTYGAIDDILLCDKDGDVVFAVALAAVPNVYTLPETVTTLSELVFAGSKITSFTAAQSNLTVGYMAFKDCVYLVTVTLGSDATLESQIFENCVSLKTFEIPTGSVVSDNLLGDNKDITIIGEGTLQYKGFSYREESDGIKYLYITEDFGDVFKYDKSISNVIIGGDVTAIANNAFAYCTNLINVIIEDGVKTIGNLAFSYCSNLKSIVIPNSVTSIAVKANGAFIGCNSLERMTTPFVGGARATNNTSPRKILTLVPKR